MEQLFDFKLTEQEANIIMAGLSKLPYEIVSALIDNLREQYAAQQKNDEEFAEEATTK